MELKKTELKVTVYGKEISMHKPTFGQVREMQKMVKSSGDDGELDVIQKFLTTLGMPAEMVEELEISHVKGLVEFLTDAKKNTTGKA